MDKLIRHTVTAHGVHAGGVFVVDLGYHPAWPLEVRMRFHDATESQTWVVSRDVLNNGTMRDSGDGFVLVTPVDDNEFVSVTLVGQTHAAEFYFYKDEVLRFLVETYERVPKGSEGGRVSADLDKVLEAILKGH